MPLPSVIPSVLPGAETGGSGGGGTGPSSTPTLDTILDGGPSSSGCVNSVVTVVAGGSTHDVGGLAGGGGTQNILPEYGHYRTRDAVSWSQSRLDAINIWGPIPGHYAVYNPVGTTLAFNASELAVIDAGQRLHVFCKVALPWTDVVAGVGDARLLAFANSLKSRPNVRFIVTFHHEPDEETTEEGGTAGTAAQFAAQFRYCVDFMRNQGVTNADYAWVIMNSTVHQPVLAPMWPGNNYVDIVGVQRYIGPTTTPASLLATRMLEDLQWFWDNYVNGTRNWRPLKADGTGDVPFIFSEWGADVNGPAGTAQHRADAIQSVIDNMDEFAEWGVREFRYFDSGFGELQPKPSPDAETYQDLADLLRSGTTISPAVAPTAETRWNALSGVWTQAAWMLRPDSDPSTSAADYYWETEGRIANSVGQPGSVWDAGLHSFATISSPAFTGKTYEATIVGGVDAVVGNIADTYAGAVSGGFGLKAPYNWTQGRTYRLRVTREPSRGVRWFAFYIRDELTSVESWLGSIRAPGTDSSELHGTTKQITSLLFQTTPADTCPLLPRATAFFGTPSYSPPVIAPPPGPAPEPKAWWLPTGPYNPNNRQTSEVYNALVGRTGSRQWSFRYELLDGASHNIVLPNLEEVISCTVEHQYLADIKRQAKFSIRDLGRIDYLNDRIRPFVRLHVPPYGEMDWVEWPLGVFLLTSPTRHADEYDRVEREVEGFDPLQALGDDLVSARYVVTAGSNIVNAAATLVAGTTPLIKVTRSTETMPTTKEWPPGTSKRSIANELLSMAGYDSVAYDSWGNAILKPYQEPTERPSMWTYSYGQEGLIVPNVDQSLDLFAIPNKVVLTVSEPDKPMLVASATNSNPASPTSTVRRGRTIVDFREQEDVVSQTVLNTRARQILFAASQIYEHLVFETGLMPIHGTNDVYAIDYDPLAINSRYAETSWTITCEAGVPMRHEARRLVSI